MVYILTLLLISLSIALAADRSNFKTCQQASFCRRHREQIHAQKWIMIPESLTTENDEIKFDLHEERTGQVLTGAITSLVDGQIARIWINEKHVVRQRFDASKDAFVDGCCSRSNFTVENVENGINVKLFTGNEIKVQFKPFKIDLFSNGFHVISLNQKELFKFELYKPKEENECTEEGCWDETFKSSTDSKPFGPMSVGMDITFVNCDNVYGIPEHSDRFNLKNTKESGDPYRLYNVDIFEYEAESPMSLYGAIPMMVGHTPDHTTGVLWLNPSETWIDIESSNSGSFFSSIISSSSTAKHKLTHWISETGLINLYVMFGPKPKDVLKQNAQLAGTQQLPPVYSIGYHQCRWNYWSQDEVNEVDVRADEHDIPLDAIWLDVEYTEGRSKKYFTWDPVTFSNPKSLVSNLTSKGRRLIAIIDPHLKKDSNYHVYNEAAGNNFFIKDKNDNDYEGWCWPGASFWPDYLNPKVRLWWGEKFDPKHFPGFDGLVDIWNDMNEPSVFSGPEITAPRDLKHYEGYEHRDIHNMYGFLMTKSTYEGLTRYRPNTRPLILTRSYFFGSQRYTAVWTGDNMSKWEYLKKVTPMVLSNSIVGYSFVGADVPGFFFNPESEELVVRWYQAGAFHPFYRAHAHLDTKRREPWLFSENTKNLIREAIRLRYSYLPYMYMLFYENELTGVPVNRPLWVEFPSDVNSFQIDETFLLGEGLLVAPVHDKETSTLNVYFPGNDTDSWIRRESFEIFRGGKTYTINAPINSLPHFQRSGTIIMKRERIRRSALLTINDPISLDIFVDNNNAADGRIYLDDGQTFNYKNGQHIYGDVKLQDKFISFEIKSGKYDSKSWVERINVFGWTLAKPIRIVAQIGSKSVNLQFKFDEATRTLVIRKPGMALTEQWKIKIT